MGRIKFSIAALALMILLCISGFFIIYKKTYHLIGLLDEIQARAELGNDSRTLEAAERLWDEWESYQSIVSIFIRNEKISEVQLCMTRIKPLIGRDSTELYAELAGARAGLMWIVESEIPKPSNIL